MQQKKEMQQGWDFATGIMGADLAAHMGMEYVDAVDAAIKQLEDNINVNAPSQVPCFFKAVYS